MDADLNSGCGRDEQTYSIIGAAMAVHRELGSGFLESVYQEALEIELRQAGIPFEREVGLPVSYRGVLLGVGYRADFVCFGEVIVELKAITTLTQKEDSQLLNYLKASDRERGLLLNFCARSLEYKRMVRSNNLRVSV